MGLITVDVVVIGVINVVVAVVVVIVLDVVVVVDLKTIEESSVDLSSRKKTLPRCQILTFSNMIETFSWHQLQ